MLGRKHPLQTFHVALSNYKFLSLTSFQEVDQSFFNTKTNNDKILVNKNINMIVATYYLSFLIIWCLEYYDMDISIIS